MTNTTVGQASTTTANGKRLRREVQALLSEAREHLPEEFRSRLRDVSALFFDHRREVRRIEEALLNTERQVREMREVIAEHTLTSEGYKSNLKSSEKLVDQLTKDLTAKQDEIDTCTEDFAVSLDLRRQMQFMLESRIDDLIHILGDTALGERTLEVASIQKSDDVLSRIESSELSEHQIGTLVARAVGYFIAQLVPDDCVYEWHPLNLTAFVTRTKGSPHSLHISVTTCDEYRRDRDTFSPALLSQVWDLFAEATSHGRRMV